MTPLWLASVRCPRCPTCRIELLPQMSSDSIGDGSSSIPDEEFWCQACGNEYVPSRPRLDIVGLGNEPPKEAPRAIRAPERSARFIARVMPDGTITMRVDGSKPVVLTKEQARCMSNAFTWLGRGAQGRQEALVGADRWIFTKTSEGLTVRFQNEQRRLVAYVARVRRGRRGYIYSPHDCGSCNGPVLPGKTAYKAITEPWETSRVAWKDIRFCAACVEAAPQAEQRGPFRVFDGGKATG